MKLRRELQELAVLDAQKAFALALLFLLLLGLGLRDPEGLGLEPEKLGSALLVDF